MQTDCTIDNYIQAASRRQILFLAALLPAVAIWGLSATAARGEAMVVSGVTHRYSFDDGVGTTAVDSASGINASLQAFGPGDSQWIGGMFGGAVNFTSESAYVITDAALAAGSANQFSVSFWARRNSQPNSNDSVLVTPRLDNWVTYNPTGNTNGQSKRGIGVKQVRDASPPLLGVWENYVVTFDRPSGSIAVYRDGELSDAGTISLPSLSTQWVFGHNQDAGNTNGSWHGALDEIQFYDRVLAPAEASTLATRPAQPEITPYLIAEAERFGASGGGEYATASQTIRINPNHVDWIAWNRFADLRAVSDDFPGELLLGTYTPEVDDYFLLTVTNPLGESMTLAMDQNGVLGAPTGQQSVIFGADLAAPVVVRGDNLGSPSFFNETGAFNDLFTVAGDYTFDFSFRDIGGDAGYPDVYLLVHAVPEPSGLALAVCAAMAVLIFARRRV